MLSAPLAAEVKYSGTVRAVWKSCPAWESLPEQQRQRWFGSGLREREGYQFELRGFHSRGERFGYVVVVPTYVVRAGSSAVYHDLRHGGSVHT